MSRKKRKEYWNRFFQNKRQGWKAERQIMKRQKKREWILLGMFCCLFVCLSVRLYRLQIIDGEEYAKNVVLKTKKEIPITGTRGNIYDRKGRILAGNRLSYTLTLKDTGTYETNRERQLFLNGEAAKIQKLLKEKDDQLVSELKIRLNTKQEYEFTVAGTALDRFRADIFGKAKKSEMSQQEKKASAETIIAYLEGEEKFCLQSESGRHYTDEEKIQYGLPDSYTQEEKLEILSIRYSLSLNAYQKYLPAVIAQDVSEQTAAAVLERQNELTGAEITEESIRYYEGGEAMSSILGYTGKISSEELSEKGEPYTLNSVVGKAGMEQYLDAELFGADGSQEVYVNNTGKILYESQTIKAPCSGKDVWLSIDKDLQTKVYKILEKKITQILLDHMINKKYFDKTAVSDASDILIPVYDVYCALIKNHVLDMERLEKENASVLEKQIYKDFLKKKKEVMILLKTALETKKAYKDQTKEIQQYETFLTKELDLIETDKIDSENKVYKKWQAGECSVKEYLYEAGQQGWINMDLLDGKGYLNGEEMYKATVDFILNSLKKNEQFDLLIYVAMVMDDKIPPEHLCLLLYEQGVLEEAEETEGSTQEQLKSGSLSAWKFIRNKLKSREITPADLALDPCSGSAIVTETDTGKVLACVSYPGYDNNRLANEMDEEYYYQIYKNASKPLYNRATWQLSAPGSTFKPVTVIAGMEEGVIGANTRIVCDGIFDKVSPSLKCWNHAGHGAVGTAALALRHSCNDYLCEISYRLGSKGQAHFSDGQALKIIRTYASLFHLDETTGLELGESKPQVTDQYAIPSAIGQGTHNYSTVQLGRYVNTLANGGKAYYLTLIERIGEGGKKQERISKKEEAAEDEITLKKETWNIVHQGMEQYIKSTGIFKNFSISVAGKSGTAQESGEKPDHGLFIGYAPADNPEISIAVRITNGYESANAVACGRDILEYYFQQVKEKR